MDLLSQVAVQVPAVALLCFVFWKLGTLAITKWSENDGEKTKAIAKGFADIVGTMTDHTGQLARIDEKLDIALENTPTVNTPAESPRAIEKQSIPSRPYFVTPRRIS